MTNIAKMMAAGVPAQTAKEIAGDVSSGLTATGSAVGDALQLTASFNQVATTATSTGVILPANPTKGDMCLVRNSGAQTLTVYAYNSGTIDGSASDSLATTVGAAYFCSGANTWFSVP